jgi:type IV pilus assembly protein PilY1
VSAVTSALAAAGSLDAIGISHAPLFVLSGSQPNFILTLDDSNSMNQAFLPDGIWTPGALQSPPKLDARDTAALTNRQYYNPAITYEPPVDASGTRLPHGDSIKVGGVAVTRLDPLYAAFASSTGCTAQTSPSGSCATDLALSNCTVDLGRNYAPVWDLSGTNSDGPCTDLDPAKTVADDLSNTYTADTGNPAFPAFLAAHPTLTLLELGSAWAWRCMKAGGTGDCPAFYNRLNYSGQYPNPNPPPAPTQLPCNDPNLLADITPVDFPAACLERVVVGTADDLAEIYDSRVDISAVAANKRPTSCCSTEACWCNDAKDDVLAARRKLLKDDNGAVPDDAALAKRNFANWFSYYRSRELTVQSALGRVMDRLRPGVRLGYQTLTQGQFLPTAAAYKSLSTTFAPYSQNRSRFYGWLYSRRATTQTYLVSAALRTHEFCKSDQAYVESPEAVNGVLVKPVAADTNPLHGCRNNVHAIFTDGFWEDKLAASAGGFDPPAWLINNDGTQSPLAWPDPSNPAGSPNGVQHRATIPDPVTGLPVALPQTYDPSALTSKVFADGNTGMLADVAFRSWIEDLRPDLGIATDAVAPLTLDPDTTGSIADQFWRHRNDWADWQHVTTITVGLGVAGNTKYPLGDPPGKGDWSYTTGTGATAVTTTGNIFIDGFPGNWTATGTDPGTGASRASMIPVKMKVDDTLHAGINGRGDYLSAGDPATLISTFNYIVDILATLAGDSSAAAAAINTGSTASADLLYQARFNPADWSGDIRAYRISDGKGRPPCGDTVPVAGQLCEDASLGLYYLSAADAMLGAPVSGNYTNRRIFTAAAGTGKEFSWANLTDLQKMDFLAGAGFTGTTPPADTDPYAVTAKNIVTYVAGDNRLEDNKEFRLRTTVLGDFINAAPVLVGAPAFYYKAPGYMTGVGANGTPFKDKSRPALIYAGANDGMLHAFNADSLTESFAFIPPALMGLENYPPDLRKQRPGPQILRDPTYAAGKHRNFVDGPIATGDVRFGTAAAGDWHTVLIAGLGLGAQALYALDVTNPPTAAATAVSSFAGSMYRWQITDRNDSTTTTDDQRWDPDLGYVFGRPAIVRIPGASGGEPVWVAITGNGYNSAEKDGSRAAGCDDPSKDQPGTGLCGQAVLYVIKIETGEILKKFQTGVGRKDDPQTGGDKRPNALGQPTIVGTTVHSDGDLLADYAYAADLFGNLWRFDLTGTSALPVRRLFSATGPGVGNALGAAQPITAPVAVARHPTGVGTLVLFGTGKYLDVKEDVSDGRVQSFYAIWDKGSDAQPPVVRNNTQLQVQTFVDTDIVVKDKDGVEVTRGRTSSANTVDWSTKNGWYIDLDKEKTVSGVNKGERVVVAPEVQGTRVIFVSLVPEGNPCVGEGYGWINALDLRSGAHFPSSPFDYNMDGVFDRSDLLGGQAGTSVRFTPGGKATGVYSSTSGFGDGKGRSTTVVSSSAGGLHSVNDFPFLQWRVWQQLP